MRNWIQKLVGPRVAASAPVARNTPAPSSVPMEALEERRLCASSLSYGLGINKIDSSNYGSVVKTLKATGTHTVRMWVTVNSYSSHNTQGIFKYIEKIHAAGYDVTLTVAPKNGLTASTTTVHDYFDWIAGKLGGSVDRWEIGNEVDKARPWSGHLASYVTDLLRPAYLALHSHGEKVVSSSVSWNPADIATMVKAGMLNYCDYVGYHPYRDSVADLKSCVAQVKALAGGKPLVASEWNVRGDEGDKSAWASEIAAFWPVIRDNFYVADYYAATKTGTMAGAAGIMTSNGGANGAFYSAYKDLKTSSAPLAVVGGKTASAVKAASSDDDVDDNRAPAVTGFRIFDAATGSVLYSNVSGTLKVTGLDDKKIVIRALTSAGTESVDFGFSGRGHHIENDGPYSAFAKSGKASSWTVRDGTFTLDATAFSKDDGKGTTGTSKSLVLKFA